MSDNIKIIIDAFSLILCFAIPIIFAILLSVYTKKQKKQKEKIIETSTKIKKLKELNEKTNFKVENNYISLNITLNSRKKLNDFDFNSYIYHHVNENYIDYLDRLMNINENNNKYEKYKVEVAKIKTTANEEFCKKLNIKLKKYIKYEDEIFNKTIQNPTRTLLISMTAIYTTPARQDTYTRSATTNLEQLRDILSYLHNYRQYQATKEYQTRLERSKLSNSIRYDVLRRDEFKCQICGRTANDGVKLHVDHIQPISKGGKTIMSNLRTLCEMCNLGKSNKIE